MAHANLGTWCEQNGLHGEAIAHFTTAVHLDPSRESSWRHLGYVKRNGRWVSAEEAAATEKEDHAQRLASRHWEPLLRKWKGWLGASPSHREQAEEHLATVTDPHAVPSILKAFPIGGSEADESRLVRLLEPIDDPRSSRALAEVAVKARSVSVRTAAIEALASAPRRDYVGALVDGIRTRIRYAVQPVEGPGSQGSLLLETPRVRMVRTYNAPAAFRIGGSFYGYVGYDANGLPVVVRGIELRGMSRDQNPMRVAREVHDIEVRTATMLAEANIKAQAVQQRMTADINQIETMNAQAEADDARSSRCSRRPPTRRRTSRTTRKHGKAGGTTSSATAISRRPRSPSSRTCRRRKCPRLESRPASPRARRCTPSTARVRSNRSRSATRSSARTPSPAPSPSSPSSSSTTTRPARPCASRSSSGDSVVCSVYHRFWRANLGWAMARELKSGDVLRTLGGLVRVAKVEPDVTQPLYNLDVARLPHLLRRHAAACSCTTTRCPTTGSSHSTPCPPWTRPLVRNDPFAD